MRVHCRHWLPQGQQVAPHNTQAQSAESEYVFAAEQFLAAAEQARFPTYCAFRPLRAACMHQRAYACFCHARVLSGHVPR